MKLLLDTHLLLWAAGQSKQLPRAAVNLIDDPQNILYFSAASIWEISIKNSLEREDFQVDVNVLRRSLLDNGYAELAITSEHAVHVKNLPPLHKDPFDRILIAQSNVEGITLLTSDAAVAKYDGSIRKV